MNRHPCRATAQEAYDAAEADLSAVLAAAVPGVDLKSIYCYGSFLDILPACVDKGAAAGMALRAIGASRAEAVVAGDSENDIDLFRGVAAAGVAVGNAKQAFTAMLQSDAGVAAAGTHVYSARATYAHGVIEGMRHFGLMCQTDA